MKDNEKNPDKSNDDQKPDEDFWIKILAEAQTEAKKRLGDTDATVMDQMPGETQPDNSQNQAEPAALGRNFIPGFLLLNTYRIDSAAIKGGMGSVWKIHHTGWDVDLAMKQPLAKLFANEMMKENFIRECQAWIDLGFHPNIVSCYYVRDIEGVPTIFSEWMENGSLENRIQDSTLYKGTDAEVQERLLDIAIQYARGLRYAHESGLIHQDVKPDNVLLTNDWQAKAADFGLAKARAVLNNPADNTTVSEDAGATHVAPSGGYTPAYCSMEQMEGKPLTRRTDIYSWAVSVMEMYHGSRPWTNGVVAGLNCHDYFKNGKAAVPDSLQDLLAKCMAPDPADRPHDFAVIEKILIEIYQATTTHPYPRPELKAAADTADSLNNRALSYLDMGMPEEAEKNWKHALELEPNHLPAIYNQGLYLWRQGKSTDRDLLLRCEASGEIGPRFDRLKGQIDGERGITDWKMQPIKTAEGYRVPEVAVSADGARIYAATSNFLKCWKSSDLTRCKFSKPGISNGLHLSQDSHYMLFVPKDDRKILCIADAETGKGLRTLRGHRDWVHSVCTHPDGIHCYTVSSDKDVRMWNMQTGFSEAVTQLDDFPDLICLSPDTKLLCVKTITNLVLLDARTLEILSSYTNSNVIRSTSCGMQFSPDSNHIYFASEHGLFRFHAADLSSYETLASDARYECLCLNQDGTRMLTGDYNGNLKLWDLQENRCLSTFTGNKNYIESIAASSDFSVILSGSKGVHIGTCIHTYRKAPWELCKAESYAQIVELQENITLTESLIQLAVESGEITQSLDLLKYAEEKYGLSHFSALRRQIAAYCRKGNITASYELGTLPLDMERAGSAEWAKQLKPMYMLNKKPLYLDFDPRGDFLAVGLQPERGGLPSTLQLWNAKHEITDLIPLPGALGYWKHAKAIRYSPSGRLLAIGMTGKVMVWNTEERKPMFTFESCPGEVRAAFSPDEKWLLCGGKWDLFLLELKTGKQFRLENGLITDLCFSPDGKTAIVNTGEKFMFYDIGTKKVIHEAEISADQFFILPQGDRLLISRNQYLQRNWVSAMNMDTRKESSLFSRESDRFAFSGGTTCVSPDGNLMAVRDNDGIQFWSLKTKKRIHTLSVPDLPVLDMAFSPDGCVFAACCDHELRLWGLQRELDYPGRMPMNKAALPYLVNFMKAFPKPDEKQIQMFLADQKNRGFGYIDSASVRSMIQKIADSN